ncbi:hypothetical protein [Streptomyces sp. H27-H5]|uniref:hypothetical protein n=1 Tax=Streptomyces sp. H27-H5 TaxID=2996460 RepID=UPI002270F3A8|nr:hypothetical protein [Streptomyces sp. H27-H5]MCY0958415.1 hypothetical protein [Streptomyces sp. H27-H5]
MQEINFPDDVRKMLWILIGEMPLEARENLAYDSRELYLRFGRGIRDLQDEIQLSISEAATSLPDDVADPYVRALSLLTNDGGVNHLNAMVDKLDDIARGQIDHSMSIQQAKWEIIAEIIALLVELALLAALAVITGGTSVSQMMLARARSRLAVLLIVDRLLRMTHLAPTLTSAIEEALQVLAVRLAQIALNPNDRRPHGIDWEDVGKGAAFGALAGGFASVLGGAFDHAGKWFKNTFDSFDDFAKKNPFTTKLLDGVNDLGEAFLVGAISESAAEVLVKGAFEGVWEFKWETFVGSGTSSMFEVMADGALGGGGLWLHKWLTDSRDFTDLNDIDFSGGPDGRGPGGFDGPPRSAPVPVPAPTPNPTPVPAPVPPALPAATVGDDAPFGDQPSTAPTPTPPTPPAPFPMAPTTLLAHGLPTAPGDPGPDGPTGPERRASAPDPLPHVTAPNPTPPQAIGRTPGPIGTGTPPPGVLADLPDASDGVLPGDSGTDRTVPAPSGPEAGSTVPPPAPAAPGTGARPLPVAAGTGGAPDDAPRTVFEDVDGDADPDAHAAMGPDTDAGTGTGTGIGTGTGNGTGTDADTGTGTGTGTEKGAGTGTGARSGGNVRPVGVEAGGTPDGAPDDTPGDMDGEGAAHPNPALETAAPRPTTPGGAADPPSRVRGSSPDTSTAPGDEPPARESAEPPGTVVDTPASAAPHGGPAPRTGNPTWEAARSAVPPVTREHPWTDDVPAPADPARPGESVPRTIRSVFDVRRVEHEGAWVTDLTVQVATGPDGMPEDAWQRVRAGVEEYFNAPGHRLPSGDLLQVTVEQAAGAPPPDGFTGTPAERDGETPRTPWWTGADPADHAVRIARQLGLHGDIPAGPAGDHTRPVPAGSPREGLRGRDLSLLASLIDAPSAAPDPDTGFVPAAPVPVRTVGGPPGAATPTPLHPAPATTSGLPDPAPGEPAPLPTGTGPTGTARPAAVPASAERDGDGEEPPPAEETATAAADVPVRLEQWSHRRASAPAFSLHLDWFDPASDPLDERRAPGTLHGLTTLVRARVRRVQADDGRWVRVVGLHLPVRFGPGFDPAGLPAFQERMRALLAAHVNHGLRLPGSGDQLHVDLVLTHAPDHAEAVELSRGDDPARSDQLHIRLGGGPGRDDAVALHEILHYTGMRDRGRDPESLFRRLLAADSTGVMADTGGLPATGVVTEVDLRTLESALDSGPAVRDHPLTAGTPAAGATTPGAGSSDADPLPPDEHDDRWESARAPRDWRAPLSTYATTYGTGYDGTVGLVHVEPLSDAVVEGLHRQILTRLGIPAGAAHDHPVRVQLRERANAVELARQLPYLRSTGRRITVTHEGRERPVDIRLGLRDPARSRRYGEHGVEDPEGRVERRGQGSSESSVSQNSGNVRTVPVTWSGAFTVGRAGPVSRVDAALAVTLTHNQFSTSSTVTSAVQTMTAQRSNELSQPVEFVSEWQLRVDQPAAAGPGSGNAGWGDGERHGPVTVWFPQHLAVEPNGPMPAPAALDDLPVWGVDTVTQPARLLSEVRDAFRDDLSDLSDAAAEELEAFLSEPVLRGTLPLQRGGGLYSPILLNDRGKAIGVLRLTTVVEPDPGPTHRSIDGKINLEAHVSEIVKVDSSVKYASGVAVDGSVAPVFTSDTEQGHPGASSRAQGTIAFKGGGKWQTNSSLSAGGSATLAHAVRTNRSHLLTPARVTYRVTLVRARGGSTTHQAGPWDGGLRMRVLAAADAQGQEHAVGKGTRQLPDDLENLASIGLSAAPLAVTGAEPMFRRAEAWLRDEGFLPPTQRPRAPYVEDEERAQAQLANLRRFELARSEVGLRASADALLDGGRPFWMELPSRTGGTRRVQLRLSATRDPAARTRHRRTLPGIQVMGISSVGVPGNESRGRAHGWQVGIGGGPSGPVGDPDEAPWTLAGAGDYTYGRQSADTLAAGSGNSQDQFFIGSGQDAEVFEVPALLALDLYEDGTRPKKRFADPGDPPGTRPRPPDEERPPVHTVPGRLTLAVPHHRTQPAGAARPAPAGPRVRAVNAADRTRLAMTDRTGNPVPNVVRLPDDAIMDSLQGSAALVDAFDRIVTGTHPGNPPKGALHKAWDATTGFLTDLANKAGGLVDNLDGADPTDESTPFREALRAGLGTANLIARSHQIFKGGYVIEGLTLPGLGADHEFSVELQGYLHDPENPNSASQYLETDVGATDTLAHQSADSTTHQIAGSFTAAQRPAPAPHAAEGGAGKVARAAKDDPPASEPGTLFNPSGRQALTRRTDTSKTVTSSTGVTRTPTEGGMQHRIRTGATILVTVRHGRRNLVGNTLGVTGADPVTIAVEIPRGAQFLMSDTQLSRDSEWFRTVASLTPTPRPAADLPLPDRFARTGEPGLAGILSVRQFAPAAHTTAPNTTAASTAAASTSAQNTPAQNAPAPGTSVANPGAAPTSAPPPPVPPATAPVERRDALRTELTRLVEQEAPGSTSPGHAAYLSGVRTRIADLTTSTALRALPARGPGHAQRFHFLHVAKGGARLVEVSLQARPRQDTAGLRTVRGRRAGAGAGQEQVHVHAPSNTSVGTTTTRQSATTFTPNARYPRPADDTRTDRTGPALTYTTSSSDTARTSSTDEDRYWMRTDNAADFEVEYEYTASVRSELVTEWPLNIPGGMVEAGVIGWFDENTGWIEWARRILFGRPERTATVPALVTLRFTGSEAVDPPAPADPLAPSVSAVDPRAAGAPAAAGGRRIGAGQRVVPTGPAPVFHFNAYRELSRALVEVAPDLAPGLSSTSLSESAEAAAVRIGELIQAENISVDLPRGAGITSSMPGAYPAEQDADAPPGLRIEVRNPRRITDAGDVTLDRLRLPGTTASTALTVGGASNTVLQTAHTADALNPNHLFGAGLPVLGRQPPTQGPGTAVTASRREWFKLGGTSLPADGGRGTRSHETMVDVLITVTGPGGTRYVTGSAEMRLTERDVLGHGITDARTDPQVYDLRSMLAGQPAADLRDWTRHPVGDLPAALAGVLDLNEDAAQIWLAPGPDPDGSLLGRALYAASRTAVLAARPVELVLRTDDGLQHWVFGEDGSLASTDAATVTAWNSLADTITEHSDAQRGQDTARRRESDLRAPRAAAVTALDGAVKALATAETAHRQAVGELRGAVKAHARARTALTHGKSAEVRLNGRIRRTERDITAVERRLAATGREERARSVEARTAAAELRHMARQTKAPRPPLSVAAVQAREQRARTELARIQGQQTRLRTRLNSLGTDLATTRTAAQAAGLRLPGLAAAVTTTRAAEDDRRTDLGAATDRRNTAEGLRDRRRTALDAVDLALDTARKEQIRQAAIQTTAARRLAGLARTLGAARRTAGEGLIDVPLSSVTSTPARGPRTALATRSTATPATRTTTAASSKKPRGKNGVKPPLPSAPKGTVGGTQTLPGTGTGAGTGPGTGVGTGPVTPAASGQSSRRPAAGRPLRTVANGECLPYAFLAGAPRLVRDRLPGLATNDPAVFAWLSNTAGVRADLHAQATALSYTGALPPHHPSQAAVAALRTTIAHRVQQSLGGTPLPDQVVLQLRASVADEFARHLNDPGTSRADLLALAVRHGVGHTAALTDGELRDELEAVYRTSTAPLDTTELQGLLNAVRTWENSWASDYGDVFLMLTAHVLGVAVDVAQPEWVGGPSSVLERYGPQGAPVVEVHYSPRHRHYWGSDAIPATAPATTPAPALNSVPAPTQGTDDALIGRARSAGIEDLDIDEALLSALDSEEVTRLLDRSRPVPVSELTGAGVVLTAGQSAQAVLLGGSLTVEELGLSSLQHLRWLLSGPAGEAPAAAVWEAVARALGIRSTAAPAGGTFAGTGTDGGTSVNSGDPAYVVTGDAS